MAPFSNPPYYLSRSFSAGAPSSAQYLACQKRLATAGCPNEETKAHRAKLQFLTEEVLQAG